MELSLAQLKSWYQAHAQEIQNDFFTFLRFRSIGTDPQYDKDTKQTADWLCDYLKKIGMEAELWQTSGHPVVFGSYMKAGEGRPTVLLYNHYDVQPADPLELWTTDPFQPTIRNNQVYARGALDNKGQCFYSITALRAFLELSKKIGVNIKIFIEGEEESGGKGTFGILPQRKKELQADHLLVIDMDIAAPGIPAIHIGMRGLLSMEVECINSQTDLHSGTHGGIALNPNRALVELLSKLWDSSGKVAVTGFYDEVKPVSKSEWNKLSSSFDIEAYKKSFGVQCFAPEGDYSLLESNWIRPTLEINGMSGGYAGTGFKTVIPAKAIAKISCRIVPDQDPVEIGKKVADFLIANAPEGLEVRVHHHHGGPPFRSDFDAPIAKISAGAYEEVFGQPCRWLLSGATIPIVADLARVSGAEAAMIGMGLAEDNIHAPNEHFGLDRFEQGFLTINRILAKLSN